MRSELMVSKVGKYLPYSKIEGVSFEDIKYGISLVALHNTLLKFSTGNVKSLSLSIYLEQGNI